MSAKNYSRKTRSATKRTIKVATPSPKVNIVCVGGFGAHALSQLTELFGLQLISGAAALKIPPATPAARFTKVSAAGTLLPASATEWEGVYDASTGLIWGRKLLPGEANWQDSLKKAEGATLCGAPARAPTIRERLSIVDYDRVEPALDVAFFDPSEKNEWEWTSTGSSSPSGCAWVVSLGSGYSSRYGQSDHFHVRAVRAGQF